MRSVFYYGLIVFDFEVTIDCFLQKYLLEPSLELSEGGTCTTPNVLSQWNVDTSIINWHREGKSIEIVTFSVKWDQQKQEGRAALPLTRKSHSVRSISQVLVRGFLEQVVVSDEGISMCLSVLGRDSWINCRCFVLCEWSCAWAHQYLYTIQFAVLCSIAVVSCTLGLLRGGRGAFLELNSDSYSSCFT